MTQTGGAQKAWGKIGDYVSDGTLTRSQGHSLWQLVSAAAVRKDDGLPTSAEGTEQGGHGLLSAEGEQASTGKTPAADSMGVASSGREAIAELKDMAVSRKEGDRISVAFEQNGKTVVYETTVGERRILGLIFQRQATAEEAAALKEKLDTSGETGLIRIPGGKQGKANNELQLPLPLTSRGMDGTLKLPGDPAFYGEAVSGEGVRDEGVGNDADVSYKRPSGFRKGVKSQVWENAKNVKGDVIDPVSGKFINSNELWDMGHKPGFEFRKHQQSAQNRSISRKQFLDEYNNPNHYRPELPSSNRRHLGEDLTDNYFGD